MATANLSFKALSYRYEGQTTRWPKGDSRKSLLKYIIDWRATGIDRRETGGNREGNDE